MPILDIDQTTFFNYHHPNFFTAVYVPIRLIRVFKIYEILNVYYSEFKLKILQFNGLINFK